MKAVAYPPRPSTVEKPFGTFCTTPQYSARLLASPYGGERSEVAVVNDGPVDRQSRDRGAPQCAGRPNGLTERVVTLVFCIAFLKYGTLAPSQSQGFQPCDSSPRGRAKGVSGGTRGGTKRSHEAGSFVLRLNILPTHLPLPMGEVAGRTA